MIHQKQNVYSLSEEWKSSLDVQGRQVRDEDGQGSEAHNFENHNDSGLYFEDNRKLLKVLGTRVTQSEKNFKMSFVLLCEYILSTCFHKKAHLYNDGETRMLKRSCESSKIWQDNCNNHLLRFAEYLSGLPAHRTQNVMQQLIITFSETIRKPTKVHTYKIRRKTEEQIQC